MYIQYMVVMNVCTSLLLFRVWCLHVRSSNFHLEVYCSSQWKLAIVPSLQLLRCSFSLCDILLHQYVAWINLILYSSCCVHV